MPDLSYRFKAEGSDDVRAQLRAVAAEAAAVRSPEFDAQAMTEALRAVVEELRGLSGAVDQTAAAFNARTAELGGSLERVAEGTGKVGESLSTVAGGTEEVGRSLTTVAGGITEMGEATGNLGRGVAALGQGVAEAGQAVMGLARMSVTFRDLEEDLRGVGQAAQPVGVEIQRLVEHVLLFQAAKRLLGVWVPPIALLSGLHLVTDAIDGAIAAYERLGAQQAAIQGALEKTGHAAGVTAAEIMDLALAQEQAGRYTRQGLAAAMGALAEYGTVSGETFRTAARLIDDLAARTGKELPAAAKLLSTALADPARGFQELAAEGIRFTAAERAAVLEMSRAGETADAQARTMALLADAVGGAGEETDALALAQHQLGTEWRLLVEAIGSKLSVFGDLKRAIGELLEVPAATFLRGIAVAVKEIRGLFGDGDIGQEVVRLNKELIDAQARQRKAQEEYDRDGRADQLEHLAGVNEQVTALERRITELIAKGKQQVAESDRAEVEAARTQLDTLTAGITAQMDALPKTVAQRREAVNREIDAMIAKLSDLRQVQGADTAQIDEQIVKLEILRETRLRQVDADGQATETKAAGTRATEEETSALAEYLRSLDEAVRLGGLDERERKIREATIKAQNIAMKENNLLTQEEIDLIRQKVGARHDQEQADRKAEEARRSAVQEAERYARDVERVAQDIGQDISEGLWDQITGEKKGADALEWFRRWLKRLAVEALAQKIVVPITTELVGSMPGLFGIQQPAMTTGGLPVGQPVTIGGQTYLPAGQPASQPGGTGLFGGGTGLGGIDSMAARWFPGTFAMPYESLPSSLVSGIDDVGQLGYTTTANSSLPFSAGQALTAAGSLMSAVNAFQAFSQGRIGSGVGNVVSAGLGIASLAGVALGPLGPIGMIAAPLIGGLLDGLFQRKPSNREAGYIWDFSNDTGRVESQTGKKAPDAAAQQASTDATLAIRDLGRRMEELSGGTLTSSIFFGRGGRDPLRVQYNGREERFENSDEGAKKAAGWFAQRFAEELRPSFEEHVGRAVANIDFTDIEEGFRKLKFAMDFRDTVAAMSDNLGLEDAARKQAKASMRDMTDSLKEFLKTTDELWPGTTAGATTRTETVREQVRISAAEAIAQGLLTRSTEYVGSETYETVWRDAEGRIVQVGEDLAATVTVWREATKTVTEGGEAVASAESTQARAGVKSLVDRMIAGEERETYTEVEAAVAGIEAAWDESVVKPLLELAGYAKDEIPAKIEEGLTSNLTRLKEQVAEADERLMRQLDGQGAFNTIDDLIDARDARLKDYAALGQGRGRADEIFDAQIRGLVEGLDVDQLRAVAEEYTGAIADAANAVRDVALRDLDIQARTGLRQAYDPGYRMPAEDALRLLDLGRSGTPWRGWLRDLDKAAGAGTLDETAALDALDDLQAALDDGAISLVQYNGLLGLLHDAVARNSEATAAAAAAAQEAAAAERARRSTTLGLEQALDPGYRREAPLVGYDLGLVGPATRGILDAIGAARALAAAGALTDDWMRGTARNLLDLSRAGEISTDQYAGIVQTLIEAYQDQAAAAEQAAAAAEAEAQAVASSWQDLMRRAADEQRAQWQEELSRAQEARRAWSQVDSDAARTLRELRGDGAVSPLLAGQIYTEARERFEGLAMVPADGAMTPEQAAELLAAARPYLDAARGWLDEEAYYDIWTDVQAVLERTGAEARRQTGAADDTVTRLEAQIEWLRSLDAEAASQTRLLGEMRALLAQGQGGYDSLLALVREMQGYRAYQAPADVRTAWDAASADTRTGWARELGFQGDAGSGAFWDWIQAYGKAGAFEALVRGGTGPAPGPSAEQRYLAMYSDIAAGVAAGTLASGRTHYVLHGAREGRVDPGFDFTRDELYLLRYPDIAGGVAAGTFATGKEHYDAYGKAEGRQYALGGLVTGGVWGQDSVPAWLMPGERVLSLDHARMMEAIYRMAEDAANANDGAAPSLVALDLLHRPSPPPAAAFAAAAPAAPGAGAAPPLAPLLDALHRQGAAGEAAAALAAEDRRRALDRLEEVVRLLKRLDARAGRRELDVA